MNLASLVKSIDDSHGAMRVAAFWLSVVLVIWIATAFSSSFEGTLLGIVLSLIVAFFGLLAALIFGWKAISTKSEMSQRDFWILLLALPIACAVFLILAWPTQYAARVFLSFQYSDLIDNQEVLRIADTSQHGVEIDGHMIEFDRRPDGLRMAFDRDGYVVRSHAIVHDPTNQISTATDKAPDDWFGYRVSRCQHLRKTFYYCSFS